MKKPGRKRSSGIEYASMILVPSEEYLKLSPFYYRLVKKKHFLKIKRIIKESPSIFLWLIKSEEKKFIAESAKWKELENKGSSKNPPINYALICLN